MSIEKMPNGRKMEGHLEYETCPTCRGTGHVQEKREKLTCVRCKGTGKLPSARR